MVGQMVAVGYEHERGIRQKFQKCDGRFSASGSRTMAKAYAAWTDEKSRESWLPGSEMEITLRRRANMCARNGMATLG